MARGGRIGYKRKTRNKVRLDKKGSDESDEDYMVSEDESEDEYCSSQAEDESEESLGEYEEEDWVEKKVKKVGRGREQKGSRGRKRSVVVKAAKKKVDYSEEEEEEEEEEKEEEAEEEEEDDSDDYDYENENLDYARAKQRKKTKFLHKQEEDADGQERDDFDDEKPRKKSRVSCPEIYPTNYGEKPRKKKKVSYREEKEDDDYDDEEFTPDEVDGIDDEEELTILKKNKVSYQEEKDDDDYDDDEDDEEFTPDEVNDIDDEEELTILKKNKVSRRVESENDDDEEFMPDAIDGIDEDEEEEKFTISKKNKVRRLRSQEAQIPKGPIRKRSAEVRSRTKQRKTVKKQALSERQERRVANPNLLKKKKINQRGRGRRRKASIISDSDFVSSGSSDVEFTVSEEEREQVKEASEFCKRLTSNLKSSSSSKLKLRKEEEKVPAQRKCPGRKGKEKVEDVTVEVGKQVCGICLSEEGKRTVRGCLNCCSHYFCFACIMEWSKVESRCPLCKQRFTTISRAARADGGHGLREAVIVVPERDQVYQPSEEELRSYLDPYENFFCTECHLGGDDAIMLLCDLCDSPAHTYCVGLGREVPDGNWYCDGCRPTALASSNIQAPNPPTDHGASNNSSPVANVRQTFDLNELYVPDTPMTQLNGHSPSPRQFIGDSQAASPASGHGALTLHERRRIQRQIHLLLNNRIRMSNRTPMPGFNRFGSQINQNAVVAPQQTVELVRMVPQNIYHPGRLQNYTPPLYSTDVISPRLTSLRGQGFPNQASTSINHLFGGTSQGEYAGVSTTVAGSSDHQQLHPCSVRSTTGIGSSTLPHQFREVRHSSLEKEQVQSMVRSHLKRLSRNLEIGRSTFKYIARTATHTILAAVGLKHNRENVYKVQVHPLVCHHFEVLANKQMCLIKGQCSSCFDWFTWKVVQEIVLAMSQPRR